MPGRRRLLDSAWTRRDASLQRQRKGFGRKRMPKVLSEADVSAYRDKGYHFPVDALSPGEVAAFRKKLEDYEATSGGPIKGEMRHRSHVLFAWIDEMIRHPRILD